MISCKLAAFTHFFILGATATRQNNLRHVEQSHQEVEEPLWNDTPKHHNVTTRELVDFNPDGYLSPKGVKNVLMVRLTTDDASLPTASKSQLEDSLFGNGVALSSQIEACSIGQLTLKPFDGTVNGRCITKGVYETRANLNSDSSVRLHTLITGTKVHWF